MAHLMLGDEQVESEREVVANERRFRVEDDVDGFLNEELYKLAFTVHPYHWPTIGWMRDIEAITIDDCRTFYRTYYAPNNATVVLVGDFDEDAVAEAGAGSLRQDRVARRSPPIARSPSPSRRASGARLGPSRSPPTSCASATRRRRSVTPTHAALELASEILFGGNSSRLHRKLVVESEIASSCHASTAPFRDPGLYEISVASDARPQRRPKRRRSCTRSWRTSPRSRCGAHELETAKTRLLTHFMRELRPQAGKAEALGHYETTVGDYRKLFAVADGYRAVTAADVARVVGKYLVEARRTVVIATPSASK